MKKYILTLITLFLMLFTQTLPTMAEGSFKITSANFDISGGIISLTSANLSDLPNVSDIKLVKLSNPTRTYFDVPNSVLAGNKKDWIFSTDGIKEVKISQFSTSPDIVRVVLYHDDNYDVSKLRFVQLKNGFFIRTKNNSIQNPFMQNIYRDDHSSSNDFYEYMTVSTNANPSETIARIDQAFSNHTPLNYSQELRLNTKYYIDRITPSSDMVTIGGIGSAAIEKPMILSNPTRIVFDFPNTMVNRQIRNKEYSLGMTDTMRIGQFSVNKARIVITTPYVTKYVPVYSRDNQTVVLTNTDNFGKLTISGSASNLTSFLHTKIDNLSSALTLNFDKPVVHGFDRTNSEVIIYLLNTSEYNADDFSKTCFGTAFSKAKLAKASRGLKLSVPIEHDSLVTTFLGADGKSLKIQIKEPREVIKDVLPEISTPVTPEVKIPINMPKGTDGKFKVVIDAGHGGSDVGATRNGIYEKNLTLDMAKMVEKLLKNQGYGVLMTRSDDTYVSLQDRVAYSEAYAPDIFVSIHVNSSTNEAPNGIETHYYHSESIPLAQSVHSSLASSIKANDRGTFKSKFYVINHTTAPAILIETGFISNTAERGQLVTTARKQATAKAIVEGINNYFKSSK